MDLFFAKNLKYLRQLHNISQEELANLVNYSFKNISKWENSQSIPNYDTLLIISKIFNIEIRELMEKDITLKNNKVSYNSLVFDNDKIHDELIKSLFKYLYNESQKETIREIKFDYTTLIEYVSGEVLSLLKKEKISFNKFQFIIDRYLYELRCNGLIEYYDLLIDDENKIINIKYKCIS